MAPRGDASSAYRDSVLSAWKRRVPLDRQPELASHKRQLGQKHVAQFRPSEAKVAEAERNVGILRIDLGEEPGRAGVGREQFDDVSDS